jgi:anti-anti-sigma factor
MPIQKWSESVSVVHLGDDPQFTDDLNSLDDHLAQQATDVVLDFAAVHFIGSSSIARLLKLRKQIQAAEQRLVLCGMSTQVWGTFLVTGLDKIFECSDNVPTALATLQMA